jgi:hypothetical protein
MGQNVENRGGLGYTDHDRSYTSLNTNNYSGTSGNRSTGHANWMGDTDNDYAQYSHGNANENRYSEDYSHPSNSNRSHMGSQYEQDRYSQHRDNYNRQDNDQNDEGFFERIGHGIKDVWNSIAGDEDDRGNDNRRHDNNSTYSAGGPPYNYGSGANTPGW